MHSKTCIEALYILFSHVPFPQNKRGLIWRYTTIHTFHEFEVECRCSIIILFQCSYHIIFYYHLMFAEVSIFSTRVFFRMLFMPIQMQCVCVCACVCVFVSVNCVRPYFITDCLLTKLTLCVLKIKLMSKISNDGVGLRKDGRWRCFKIQKQEQSRTTRRSIFIIERA